MAKKINVQCDAPDEALKDLALCVGRMNYADLLDFNKPWFHTVKAMKEWVGKQVEGGIILCTTEYSGRELKKWYYLNPYRRLSIMIRMASEKEITGRLKAIPDTPAYMEASTYYWRRSEDPDFDLRDVRRAWMTSVMKGLADKDAVVMLDDYSGDRLLCELSAAMLANSELRKRYEKIIFSFPAGVLKSVARILSASAVTAPSAYDLQGIIGVIRQGQWLPEPVKDSFEESLMFNTHLLPGDTDGIYEILKDREPLSMYGEFILASSYYLKGDYHSASAHFTKGFKLKTKEKKWIGSPVLDLMYVSNLLMDDSSKAATAIGRILEKKIYDVFEYEPIMLLVRALKGENVEKPARDLKTRAEQYGYSGLNLLLTATVLSHIGELSPDEKMSLKARQIVRDTPAFALFKDGSFLPPYKKPEKWVSAINELMNKLGYSEEKQPKVNVSSGARVAYLISENKYVQPILQKSKDGVVWSKGRNIAMTSFRIGIPEMNEQDRAVSARVKEYRGWYGPVSYDLSGDAVIAALAGHPAVFDMENPDIRIDIVKEEPYLVISRTERGFKVESNVSVKDVSGKHMVLQENISLYRVVEVSTRQREIISSLCGMTLPVESESKMKTLMSFLAKDIQVHSDIIQDSAALKEVPSDSRITAMMQPFEEGMAVNLYVKPFTEVAPYLTPGQGNLSVMSKIDNVPVRTLRNLKEEKANLEMLLAAMGELFPEEALSGSTSLYCPDAAMALSVLEIFNSYKETVRLEWPEGCRFRLTGSADVKNFSISVHSRTNWFEVDGSVQVDEERVLQLSEILNLYRSRKGRFIEIGEGEYLALTEKLRRQIETLYSYTSSEKGKLKMAKVAVSAINSIEEAGVAVSEDAAIKKLMNRVKAAGKEEYEIPEGLRAELRDYQVDGYRWMCRLAAWGAGACLADDMGLGKTVQSIAVLCRRAAEGPALIVAPASVMPNWLRECDRFAPSLKVSVLNGASQEERSDYVNSAGKGDVVLTTYGVLVSDAELLQSVSWSTIILDEAHVIKNKDTKQSAACMGLKGDFRIILTGTPLQNNLGELWNLYQFINPGILGNFTHFREHFLVPIQEHSDKEVQRQLKRLVQPFLLRRTKSDVLDELPQKTEQVLYVELSDNERALYEMVRSQAEMELEAHQSSLVKTISDILKLRQIVCSPELVDAGIAGGSSKIKELMRLVPDLISGHHRALVFSQFTSFLALVRRELDAEGIQYQYMDGSTPIPERQKIVKVFQKGDCPLFLISLKAGGLGLNLTAADYIIHLDPWWNPAVEDQASDRAYRIGQTKPVTVYKLIAQNTIEEKIVALHKSKKSLADSLLEGADVSSRLSREELLELLGK